MTGSVNKPTIPPRVFISYARADGENFARDLGEGLAALDIPFWMDRFGMEGGHDWWQQIVQALNQVEYLVLVMTPAALKSPNVRKEWRYARQQGVCVYPVKAATHLDYSSLPRWMRDVHWYTLDHERTKFINDLNTRCQKVRIPFMVEDLPDDFVERPSEFKELIGKLLDEKREEPVAITAALRGAGGYGKTTMARAICHDDRIQEAFDDGILWVTLGENPGNLVGKVEDLIYTLSEKRPGFTDLNAASAHFKDLLADRDILLVIDDAWNVAHLRPFLQGGERCARLITTRDESVLPSDAQRIQVDAMRQNEAVQLLSAGLDSVPYSTNDIRALPKLAARLGEWPLLLTLANGALRERVSGGESLPDALVFINEALDECGLTVFDATDAQDRSQAVAKTLGVSLGLLSTDEKARYQELAIFPEDIDIPLATLQKLWGATGGLGKVKTEMLCTRLFKLSLLLRFDLAVRTIRLHDVVRTYLRQEVGEARETILHRQLLDAYGLKRWAELPQDEPYLWNQLAYHLVGAGRVEELVAPVKDLRYLAVKTFVRNAYAVEVDLNKAQGQVLADTSLRLLKHSFVNMGHLLNHCKTLNEVEVTLHSRLCHLEELSDLCLALEAELPRPFLAPWHPLPDLPHPALIRTLAGHTDQVTGCAVSPKGDYIVSASDDSTLKVWDAQTGAERLTLQGHTDKVTGCAVSPKGDYIVSASSDNTLKVWDAQTGAERLTLQGHTHWVTGCAVSPKGDYIVSASWDSTLKVWDAQTGAERLRLQGHTNGVIGCAVSPKGDYIVSASYDSTLKVWDAQTGAERLTLQGHTEGVGGCAISPKGDYIVSASYDSTLKVWDAQTGACRLTLYTFLAAGCAVSPKGDYIVSASLDRTLKVWDAQTGAERLTLAGHTSAVTSCAVSPKGDYIVSASLDRTLKVWDAQTGAERLTLQGHTNQVASCAVSLKGDYIVSTSGDSTLKVWDAQTGACRLTLQGHTDWVMGCAVSPKGDYIVSASWDRALKVWDAQTGACVATLLVDGGLSTCAFCPNGEHIIAGGIGGVYFLRLVW